MKAMFLVCSLMVFFCSELWAQGQVIPEMVVTASRVEEPINDVAMKMVIIDQDDIRLSNATSVDQLLVEQNIGHMHVYPGSMTQVTIRGSRSSGQSAGFSSPVLILMDGRRAGTNNLAKIPISLVERIEVIKGASSAVYGAEAMGGVVNIVSKSGQGDPTASLLTEAGSASSMRLNADVQGSVAGFDFYALVGRKDRRADYRDGDGDVYPNTQSRGRESFVNLGYSFGEHRLGATVLEVDSWHIGSPGGQSDPDLDDYSSKDLRSFDIRYDGAFESAGLEWLVRYYQVDERDTAVDPSQEYGFRDANFFTDTEGAQLQVSWQAGVSRLTFGLDWDQQEARNSQEPTGKPYGVNADYQRRGFFVAEKLALLNERLLFNFGLRYDQYKVETKNTQGYTTLQTAEEDISEWCPRAGVVFVVTENLLLKGSVGRGILLPTAEELAGDFISSGWYQDGSGAWQSYNVHYLGNDDLDPEESWTYEIGADYRANSWYVNGSLFYTDYDSKIENDSYYDAVAGESVSSYKNIDGATINGVELETGADFGPLLNCPWTIEPFASLTYLFEMKDESRKDDLLYVSDTQARFGLRATSNSGFTSQVLGIYHGPQDIQNWNKLNGPIEEKGGFTVWNLKVAQRIPLKLREGMSVTVSAGVDNLLEKKYSYVNDYAMPGREYKASVTIVF